MNRSERNSHLLFAVLLVILLALPIFGLLADPVQDGSRGEDFQDTWKAGLIEGAFLFNEHLYHYHIKTLVNHDRARLTGSVSNSAERALAEQIALSVEGIRQVRNELNVDPELADIQNHPAPATFSDSAVTTKVKSRLLANTETSGLNIEVKTRNNVVILTGEVPSDVEKDLAYYVTRNTGGVRRVVNNISIKPRA